MGNFSLVDDRTIRQRSILGTLWDSVSRVCTIIAICNTGYSDGKQSSVSKCDAAVLPKAPWFTQLRSTSHSILLALQACDHPLVGPVPTAWWSNSEVWNSHQKDPFPNIGYCNAFLVLQFSILLFQCSQWTVSAHCLLWVAVHTVFHFRNRPTRSLIYFCSTAQGCRVQCSRPLQPLPVS